MKERIAKELRQEAADIVEDAVKAIEKGQTTDYAKTRLKELSKKLEKVEFELRGGCSW